MTKPVVHIAIILDQSGSMIENGMRKTAVSLYNELAQQAQLNAKDQDIRVSLLTFNADTSEHLWEVPADQLQQSTEEGYHCDGGTALRDALGYTIEKYTNTTDMSDENASYLIQLVTDGQENASRMYPSLGVPENRDGKTYWTNNLKPLIEKFQATKRAVISIMGCEQKYLQALSEDTAVPITNMAAFSPTNAKAAVYGAVDNARKYLSARGTGQHVNSCYTSPVGSSNLAAADGDFLENEVKTAGGILLQQLAEAPKAECFTGKSVNWVQMRSTNKTTSSSIAE